ncbi:putative DNA polymerase III, delta subunit [Candidatus Sulcia muelleri SMDSEM]|uniref:Putative DNA polymerase III, delta subunit n=1 Tax=Karelsulcia muelleri (strain SMDSEM) TaxID=595499 RepID=C7LKK5_KARMS|nr:putative DNA polymerase III, delta subunit [Candidatus Karelsulcia muelleri SMDSEM]WGS83126.1 MAG: DNA polymerase III subunit delta [Candidatus Karelsulcia muelleri]
MFLTFKKKIITDINNKKFKNIYFFMGEERFLIENLTNSIELFLKKKEKIKKKILYGYDLDLKKLFFVTKQIYINFSNEYNLIIVKEAQFLSENIYYNILKNHYKKTILIICYNNKVLDKRKKLYKYIKKNGIILNCVKLKTNEILNFFQNEIEEKGYIITQNAIKLLIKFLGENLYSINNEINKLFILMEKNKIIDEKIIKKYVIKTPFKVESYIIEKNFIKAYKAILNCPISFILKNIYNLFLKIIKFHCLIFTNVKFKNFENKIFNFTTLKKYPLNNIYNIISYIREADIKIKNIYINSINKESILEELLYKIFYN